MLNRWSMLYVRSAHPTSETNLKKTFAALALAAVLLPVAGAQAAVISFNNSIGITETDWSESLRFSKFNTQLGTLNSIKFDLSGLVSGAGFAENRGSSAAKVTLTLGSTIELTRPDGSTLVVANPVFDQLYSLGRYDRLLDFAGTSGVHTGTVEASSAESFLSSSASDLALFSGKGFIELGLSALGTSFAKGPGNVTTGFDTFASGAVQVTYDYTPFAEVPEPASLATILAGLSLMGAVRRRARNKA
ncbi:PEP-CTERM -sorting domain protein [Massilia timonae]|uniref:PEP-CTERM-sorting domain protein n=1 Tax=Massilia timonae TaxID=47229 RepID=A0A1S2NHU1_9BURK|nr:PEP-CTERM -sorting domain protein [Massilia timonae]